MCLGVSPKAFLDFWRLGRMPVARIRSHTVSTRTPSTSAASLALRTDTFVLQIPPIGHVRHVGYYQIADSSQQVSSKICEIAAMRCVVAGCGHNAAMGVAQKLRAARERAGLSQPELARLAGVSQASVSAWELGKNPPKSAPAARIAAVLHVTLEWLMDDAAPDTPTTPPPPDDDAELLIRVWKALGISADEAIRRLSDGGPGESR